MLRDKLSPGTKPGFPKSEKMLGFKLLYTHKSVSENVYVNNIIIYGWYYSILLTHNINGWCYCHLGDISPHYNFLLFQADVISFLFSFYWQMLLPMISGRCYAIEADVITYCVQYCSILCYGWCYCHYFLTDVITTTCYVEGSYIWLMLLPCMCGRCYNHWGWCYCLLYLYLLAGVIANIVADVITTNSMCWLMVLPSCRWNGHCRVVDVKCLMFLPLGRCYSPRSILISI